MSFRVYVVVLAGLISSLIVIQAITTPILVSSPIEWRPVPEASTRTVAPRGEWVLLPSNSGSYCLPRGFLGAYEIWRPDSSQIGQLERDLDQILPPIQTVAPSALSARIPPLIGYRRQYIGIRRFGEPDVIYVNAFLPREDDERPGPYRRKWRRDLICVDDGGWGYWHLEYDPALRRFRGFGFNGSA